MNPRFPNRTCGHEKPKRRTLRAMVRHYILYYRPRARAELWTFCRQPFEVALERAALAKDERGKRFPHQRRLPELVLRSAGGILLRAAEKLRRCDSFDQLHDVVKERLEGIRGLRRLYYYDTALHAGASLRLMPERVYLHRGTRVGARRLGMDWRADSLGPGAFPKELAALEPYEIEDFLCIYKDRLRPGMR
jgi:hypothetical protein